MSTWAWIFTIILLTAGCSSLGKKGGLVNVTPTMFGAQADLNAVKAEVSGKMGVIEGEVTGVKSEVLGLKGDLSLIKGNLENLSAQLSAQGQAVAGFNNQMEQANAGRDIVTSSVNDTKLIKYFVGILGGLCSTLIGLLGFCLKFLLRETKAKDHYKKIVYSEVAKNADDIIKIEKSHEAFISGKIQEAKDVE